MSTELDVGPLADFPQGRGRCVEAAGRSLAIFRTAAEVFAIDEDCPHRGGPLSEGDVRDGVVYCPLHAWGFELRTGLCLNVRRERVATYPARVAAGRVLVVLPPGPPAVGDPDDPRSEEVDPGPELS